MKKYFLSPALLCISLCFIATSQAADALNYKILAERSHKPVLFTQGLLVDDDHFYESSGLYGKSMLVTYPIAEPEATWAKISAPFNKKQIIPANYFAEGLALFDNQLFLLTWQEGTVLIYRKDSLELQRQLKYEGQGWGLTSDNTHLIRSDGSDTLFFHHPDDFSVTKKLKVYDKKSIINHINELEYAEGFIWANIWYQDRIIKIDPATGEVVAQLNLADLKKELRLTSREDVLNGIAWDAKQNAFWVTGKNWPKMFLIKIY